MHVMKARQNHACVRSKTDADQTVTVLGSATSQEIGLPLRRRSGPSGMVRRATAHRHLKNRRCALQATVSSMSEMPSQLMAWAGRGGTT